MYPEDCVLILSKAMNRSHESELVRTAVSKFEYIYVLPGNAHKLVVKQICEY